MGPQTLDRRSLRSYFSLHTETLGTQAVLKLRQSSYSGSTHTEASILFHFFSIIDDLDRMLLIVSYVFLGICSSCETCLCHIFVYSKKGRRLKESGKHEKKGAS